MHTICKYICMCIHMMYVCVLLYSNSTAAKVLREYREEFAYFIQRSQERFARGNICAILKDQQMFTGEKRVVSV